MDKFIVAFGEILWDLLPDGPVLGGAPFNFIYRINSLGYQGLMVSRIGTDSWGQRTLEQVKTLGLSTALLQSDTIRPTGTVEVAFDAHKEPHYKIVPGVAYDAIELNDSLIQAAQKADCICFGTLIQREKASRETLRTLLGMVRSSCRIYDVNLRPNCYTPEIIDWSLRNSNIVKFNETEMLELSMMFGLSSSSLPTFAREAFARWPFSILLITLGEKGAFAASRDGTMWYEPGYRVTLKDSCGSGDACTAGFIQAYTMKKNLAEACHFGNLLGAVVAEQRGATERINPGTLSEFCANHTERVREESLSDIPGYAAVTAHGFDETEDSSTSVSGVIPERRTPE